MSLARVAGVAALGALVGAGAPAAAQDVPARDLAIAGAGGARLAATLTLPNGAATRNAPAVLLVQGSGPTDRDGNQPGIRTDLLRQMSVLLAQRSIAALRFDKRGTGGSTAVPRDAPGDFVRWENFVHDAVAAYRTLADRPEVDPARIAILGHSEGGLLALAAAQTVRDSDPPAALVLVATPGRRFEHVLREQLAGLMSRQTVPLSEARRLLAANDAVIAAISDTAVVPRDVPPSLRALYPDYIGPFLRSLLAVDPAALAASFRGPVLLLVGARDAQISVADLARLEDALRGRAGGRVDAYVVPDASHNLKIISSDDDPGFTGPMHPAASAALESWLDEQLGASR